jgi:uncharacterized protein (DUF433 family)
MQKVLSSRVPEVMSGPQVFAGRRVPVKALFDYFEGGDSLEEFLYDFSSVERPHAISVLEMARETLFVQGTSV